MANCGDGDTGRPFGGKSVNAGGYGREGDALCAMFFRQQQGMAVAIGQQIVLIRMAALPDGTDGMDYPFRRQPVTPGDFRLACIASTKCAAFGQKFGAGCTVNGTVHTTAAEQGAVGGIDDCIDIQRGDIGLQAFQKRFHGEKCSGNCTCRRKVARPPCRSLLFKEVPMKRLLLLFILLLPSVAQSGDNRFIAPAQVERISQQLAAVGLQVDGIRPAPISGLYEVVSQGQVYYTDRTGKYLIIKGEIIDTEARMNLTAARMAEINRVDWDSLPLDKAIVSGDPNGAEVAVFTDPDCPYCRRLEAELKDVKGLKVYTFLYPLAQLHPDARAKSDAIWCARDRHKALQQVMLEDKALPKATCATPVDEVIALAEKLQIFGTPTAIARNGIKRPGAPSGAEFADWVKANQK